VYAEDPAHGFLPDAGRILRARVPAGPGVRVDAALRDGLDVSIHYDPMLAKVITSGRDRAESILRMRKALDEFVVLGIRTNIEYLQAVLAHPAFERGDLSTHFLDEHFRNWQPESHALSDAVLAAVAVHETSSTGGTTSGGSNHDGTGDTERVGGSPWTALPGWRQAESGGRKA
jgi:acetyl/propionyl-CoA carboxylase alpha subunit